MKRSSQSRVAWAWGGLAGTLLVASVGCSQNAAMVRPNAATGNPGAVVRGQTPGPLAQNPDLAGYNYRHDVQYVSHEGTPVVHSQTSVISGGQYAAGMPAGQYCPPQYSHHGIGIPVPGIPVPGVPCPTGLSGHSYSYEDPGMPVYPAGTGPALTGPGSPGAVIQYPYYTTKGPDDFFLDEDGLY